MALPPHHLSAATFGGVARRRTDGQRVNIYGANGQSGQSSKSSGKVVVLVDPLEAKRLAAEEMRRLQERAKFQRRMEIEATNGGWAMLGLTAGIVVEGHTGKSIPMQGARSNRAMAQEEDMFPNKRRNHPIVFMGALATAAVLVAGITSFRQGKSSETQQFWMRARVVAQGMTVALMVGTAFYYKEDFAKPQPQTQTSKGPSW